jgi:uncharacterized protein (TIGR01777 family)
MQTVLITGGTGMVGQSLTNYLIERGYEVIVLTRSEKRSSRLHLSYAVWDISKQYIDPIALKKADIIVHLAGESVATKRWTKQRKEAILQSRVQSGALLVKALKENEHKVKTVIAASAIGWYGPDTEKSLQEGFTEIDPADTSYLGDTCKQWEESVHPIKQLDIRLVTLRIGIVLNKRGGALLEFIKPAKLGIAAILGHGKQIVSWIHQQDLNGIILFAIQHHTFEGVFNAVAPEPIDNQSLTLKIAAKYHSWYFKVYVPAWVLKLLLGEMSIEVLKSANVSSKKLQNAQFSFQFPSISAALDNLL